MDGLGHLHGRHLVQRDGHAAQLLQKEFAGAGSALITAVDALYSTVLIEMINHEGLAAGADNNPVWMVVRQNVSAGQFYGLGFGDSREGEQISEFAARGRDSGVCAFFNSAENLC